MVSSSAAHVSGGVRPTPLFAVGASLLGGVAGIVTAYVTLTPLGSYGFWAASVLSSLGVWMVALALIARGANTPLQAALGSSGFFLAMALAHLGYSEQLRHTTSHFALLWSVAAITVVPVLAAVIAWASEHPDHYQSRDIPGGIALGIPVSLLLWESLAHWHINQPLVSLVLLVLAAVVVALVPRTLRMGVVAVLTAIALHPVLSWLVGSFPTVFYTFVHSLRV